MSATLARLLARHPLWRSALWWSLPALLAGLLWRGLLMSYLPYANWNADSHSYYSFAHNFVTHGQISLYEKRRYLYPLLLLPIRLLPGATLGWVALLQHGFALLTLAPMAWLVRRTFVWWRVWIVPVTLFQATLPMFLWFERELLAETVFFNLLIWTMAGWSAWAGEARVERARRLFWIFFVPLALFMVTKPAARFFWPGLGLGLLLTGRWRDWRVVLPLAGLFCVSLTAGSRSQGAWLLYVSCFPLTDLDSPRYAEYKAEIRAQVEASRASLPAWYGRYGWAFEFLRRPAGYAEHHPRWAELTKDPDHARAVYGGLAREAILHHPGLYLQLGLDRLLASMNPAEFNANRFRADFYPGHFEHFYREGLASEKTPLRELFGLADVPPWEEFRGRLAPPEEVPAARFMVGWSRWFCHATELVRLPYWSTEVTPALRPVRLTWLGWTLVAGSLCSLLPRYRRSLGVWALAMSGYLAIVFLATITNARYFDLAWPVLILLAAAAGDVLVGLAARVSAGAWKVRGRAVPPGEPCR